MLEFEDIVERVAKMNSRKYHKAKPLQVIAGTPDHPLLIGDIEIPCYVLEDETRVLAQRGMVSGLGMARGGSSHGGGDRLAHFVNQNTLKPFISNELLEVTNNPIKFRTPTGSIAYGYPATLLVDICNTVLEARDNKHLQNQQKHIAKRCEILLRGLAKVGIIALVDEATGYQEIRAKRDLATILERLVAKELQKWTKTFPYEFYSEICRLKGWPAPHKHKRPIVFAKYTNDLVYERLAPGVLAELKKRNPANELGRRRHKHFQWFTPDHGHPLLREHLSGVIMLMNSCDNWKTFYQSLNKARKKFKPVETQTHVS